MIQFVTPLSAGDETFKSAIKAEIEQLSYRELPLQQALSRTSVVSDDPVSAVIIAVEEQLKTVQVKCGIFYSGIIGGCNCADDPTPPSTEQEYCELLFEIELESGRAAVTIVG